MAQSLLAHGFFSLRFVVVSCCYCIAFFVLSPVEGFNPHSHSRAFMTLANIYPPFFRFTERAKLCKHDVSEISIVNEEFD